MTGNHVSSVADVAAPDLGDLAPAADAVQSVHGQRTDQRHSRRRTVGEANKGASEKVLDSLRLSSEAVGHHRFNHVDLPWGLWWARTM